MRSRDISSLYRRWDYPLRGIRDEISGVLLEALSRFERDDVEARVMARGKRDTPWQNISRI